MATTKTAEEIEHLAYQDFTFDGKTLPPGQTTPHGYRKFFRAYKKGYDRASLQTSELIEAVEKASEFFDKASEPLGTNSREFQLWSMLNELLKTHKPTPPISG